jgi:hypothetical protein
MYFTKMCTKFYLDNLKLTTLESWKNVKVNLKQTRHLCVNLNRVL